MMADNVPGVSEVRRLPLKSITKGGEFGRKENGAAYTVLCEVKPSITPLGRM